MYGGSSGITCEVTHFAPHRSVESFASVFGRVQPRFGQLLIRGLILLLAVHAQHAHESLSEHAVERRDEVIRLDAHVEESAYNVDDVVCVNGREYEVACEGRL